MPNGWHRGGWGPPRGWGPPPHRPSGGGFLGAVVGTVIGSTVVHELHEHEEDEERRAEDEDLAAVVKIVQQIPEGGTVALKPSEFRLLQDHKLLEYTLGTPHAMGRLIILA